MNEQTQHHETDSTNADSVEFTIESISVDESTIAEGVKATFDRIFIGQFNINELRDDPEQKADRMLQSVFCKSHEKPEIRRRLIRLLQGEDRNANKLVFEASANTVRLPRPGLEDTKRQFMQLLPRVGKKGKGRK